MDNVEFKFPDEDQGKPEDLEQSAPEVELEAGGEVELEIEDDTPPQDRNRDPLPKPILEELEKDELDEYSEKAKERLKQMRKVYHDERREKEAALREQQEAIETAKRLFEENRRMREMIQSGEKEYVTSIQTTADLELQMAKKAYRDAYDAGDADALLEAQQAMLTAQLKLERAKNFKLPSLQEEEIPVQRQQEQNYQQQTPRVDPRASAWQDKNPWFGQDEEMTAAALGLHEKMKRNGVVIGSDEYYATLDKTMRKRFPEEFGEEEVEKPKAEQQRTKPATVVAPASRTTASNKIKLKTSQVNLAKKLGLTPEQYALELKKLEAQNG